MTSDSRAQTVAAGSFAVAVDRYAGFAPALAFALLLVAYDTVFSAFFPVGGYRLGHDYAFVLPNLLDGIFWFKNNGLSVPWFSSAFCAGQPAFADPQSAYYSLPQSLAILLGPLFATHGTLLVAVSLMYWGGFLLMRKVFGAGRNEAILVAGLLMFNGFLPHRLIVGHMGFHGFVLVPWVALLLLLPCRRRGNRIAAGVAAGALMAYWVYSGLGTLILACAMAVLLLAIVRFLDGGSMRDAMARAALGGSVAAGLSAAKLVATFSFMAQFPRDFYPLPGASTVVDALLMIGAGLVLPSQWVAAFGIPRLSNVMWTPEAHEWAYGFGVAAALLAVILSIGRLRIERPVWPASKRNRALLAVLLLLLLWPLAYSTWHPAWNDFLKRLPLLGTASFPLRWMIVYIPVAAVATGLLMTRCAPARWRIAATAICLLATVLQSFVEPRQYYMSQGYDARPVVIANELLDQRGSVSGISSLGTTAVFSAGKFKTELRGNDTFVAGMSQVYCYNPVFGYRLEKFSSAGLSVGNALQVQGDGYLNLKNPACYVFPAENGCRPGDRFRADQIDAATAFAAYRPWPFAISTVQRLAIVITQGTLGGVFLAGLIWSGWRLRSRRTTANPD
ncbi:MAG: hypothetical protein HZA63_11885 [Rhodocyclales bacterium]|nr:hypothetical protein [Rhodocyclales bacterium]